jgi:hypothetical protein
MRFFTLMLLVAGIAHAESTKGKVSPFGTGIVFPSFPVSASVNPAALGTTRATALQVGYGPPIEEGERHRYFAAVATAKRSVGFGAGLTGTMTDSGQLTNGAFVGLGFNLDQVALGLALREANLAGSLDPSLDLGLIVGQGTGVSGGFVLYGLEGAPRLTLGIGYASGKRFNLEANVALPPFNSFGNGGLGLSLGASLFIDRLTFLFATSYNTSSESLGNTLGLGIWLSQKFNLGVQFSTPHSWTALLTFVF